MAFIGDPTALKNSIHGGLAGAVIGDALGAITETLSINQIRNLYGWIEDFQPLRHKPYDQDRVIGAWTDDASLVAAMMRAVIDAGEVELKAVINRLMEWADSPEAKFSGPSTKRAVEQIAAGADPRIVGMGDVITFTGASNGGAMKAAPAGWAHPGDPEAAAHAAAVICTPTHNTQIAIAGAAAVAAACAQACVPGVTLESVITAGVTGAQIGESIGLSQGREVAGASVERRISWAVDVANAASSLDEAVVELADRIGAGLNTHESVPAAFGILAAARGDVNQTIICGANIGDDTDTVGTMAAAIAGTYSGFTAVNPDWYSLMVEVNGVDFEKLASDFVAALTV